MGTKYLTEATNLSQELLAPDNYPPYWGVFSLVFFIGSPMTTYTVVWTPDSDQPPVVLTVDSLSVARSTAYDLMKSYSPGDSTAIITDDDGNEYE